MTFQPIQDAGRLQTWVNEGAPPLSRSLRQGGNFDVPSGTLDEETDMGAPFPAGVARSGDFPETGTYVRNFNPATDRLTLTEVRRKILEQTSIFRPEDVIPVPCHPDSFAMAYALKLNGKITPLTGMIPPEVLINGAANTILYEQEPAVRDKLFKLFATNHSPQSSAGTLRELLCCLPKIWIPDGSAKLTDEGGDFHLPNTAAEHVGTAAPGCPPERGSAAPSLSYENIFRIIIMQFIDAHSFDVRSVKKTCVHIVHPDGRLIPFDTYNLFYRDDLEQTRLAPLRRNAETALASL